MERRSRTIFRVSLEVLYMPHSFRCGLSRQCRETVPDIRSEERFDLLPEGGENSRSSESPSEEGNHSEHSRDRKLGSAVVSVAHCYVLPFVFRSFDCTREYLAQEVSSSSFRRFLQKFWGRGNPLPLKSLPPRLEKNKNKEGRTRRKSGKSSKEGARWGLCDILPVFKIIFRGGEF